MEQCVVCGFAWAAVTPEEAARRLRAVAADVHGVFAGVGDRIGERPDPETWSVREYGCHIRDVLLNLRDRVVLGVAEDNPHPHPVYAQVRLDIGMYRTEDAATLAREIDVAAQLLARTVDALDPDRLARPIFYPYPRPETRTLAWVAAQALHEAEHHLDDIRHAVAGHA